MLGVVVQIDGFDPALAQAVTLRAASHDDPAVCHAGGGEPWWPALIKLPTLRYDLFDGAFGGEITAPSSSLTIAAEPWPNLGRYALADARLQLWTGEVGAPWSSWTLRFDGRVTEQPELADGTASINFAVDDRWLDAALLSTYAGTSGSEGTEALKGQPKPLALGAPRYVAGTLVDSINTVFQLSAYGPLRNFEAALERLARFGSSVGDFASYAALIAAQVPAGQWATAKAVGMVRLGAPATGQISFLIGGDQGGPDGWARLPGAIIRRLALLSGGAGRINDASLNALDVARAYNQSIYVDQQSTARQLIQQIAASVNAVAGMSWTGQLFVVPVGIGMPTISLAADGSALPPVTSVKQIGIASPFRKLAIGAARAWTVHALSDIAFTAPLVDVGRYDAEKTYREGNIVDLEDGSRWLYVATVPGAGNTPNSESTYWSSLSGPVRAAYDDGTPVEDLKPAQPGADVTSDNTSKDTNAVSGRPASQVLTAVDKAKADIDGLVATFGTTASAAASADAARDAETNAKTARDAAQGARDAAQEARALAGGSASTAIAASDAAAQAKTDAQSASTASASARDAANAASNLAAGYRDAAQAGASNATSAATSAASARDAATQKANDAATSATSAGGSATTASGQATIATQKADAAGQSASTASAKADIATTKAGEASASSSRSAASESNAAGSATSATMQAGVAVTSAGQTLPQFFDSALTHFGTAFASAAATTPTVAGVGTVVELSGTNYAYVWGLNGIALSPGKRIRFTLGARVRSTSTGTGSGTLGLNVGVSDQSRVTARPTAASGVTVIANPVYPADDVWRETIVEYVVPATPPAGFAFPVVLAYVANQVPSRIVQLRYLRVEDVTASTAAATSAAAAAGSASTAGTSQTAAGQSASAAQASATTASTKAGEAGTSASQASTSETNARGSSNAAASSASVAATARDDAVTAKNNASTSATAAAASESNAAASKTAAGSSASAAKTSETSAGTSAGTATTKASEASTSAASAAGSANSASSSQLVAASSATQATQTAAADMPSSFSQGDLFWMAGFQGNSDNRPAAAGWTFPTVAAEGVVAQSPASTGGVDISHRSITPSVPGRRYRAVIRAKGLTAGAGLDIFQIVMGSQNASAAISTPFVLSANLTTSFADYTVDFTAGSGPYHRLLARIISRDGSSQSGQIARISLTDVTDVTAAQTAATASAGSASIATTKADAAGQSATSATAALNAAKTAQGSAEVARDQAAQSKTDAAGSASSASSSQLLAASSATQATQTAAADMPSGFSQGDLFWMAGFQGNSDNRPAAAGWTFPTLAAEGVVAQSPASTGSSDISHRSIAPSVSGRRYRAVIRAKGLTAGAGLDVFQIVMASQNASAAVSTPFILSANLTSSFADYTVDFTSTSGPYHRLLARIISRDGSSQSGQIARISLTDVTDVTAAQTAATASAGSASIATTKADAAGQSATSATAALNAAKTAQGSAEAARDQAAQSKTDAAGSASSASSSATLAAGSATTASQKASAAATSEQNAAASSTAAGQQASASEASKSAAQTARSQAETFANQASTSKDSAAGSASTASTQAGLAAQSKTDAQNASSTATGAATAANNSASTASTKADAAGASAVAANQSRIDAQAANGNASANAGAAATSAAAASASASSANTTAMLASRFSQGALSRNAYFGTPGWNGDTNTNDNAPPEWAIWFRAPGGYTGKSTTASFYTGLPALQMDRGGPNSGIVQPITLAKGWHVAEFDIYMEDGDWNGTGAHINLANGYAFNFLFSEQLDTSDVRSGSFFAGAAPNGTRRQFGILFYNGAPSAADAKFYLMAGWEGFGVSYGNGTGFVRTIWHKALIRPADQGEIDGRKARIDATTNAARIEQVNSTLTTIYGALAQRTSNVEARAGNVEARTGIVETAVASATSKLAAARVEISALSPGGRASMTIRSDTTNGAAIDFGADLNIVGTIKAQKTVGGKTITIDSDNGISFNNGSVMKVSGVGFGSNRQFIEWVGPSLSSTALCTEANALQYIKTDGSAYFGGSLSAGQLKNSSASSGTGTQELAAVGPFGSNGGTVKYLASWAYRTEVKATYAASQAGLQQYRQAANTYNANSDEFGVATFERAATTVTLARSFSGSALEQLDEHRYTTETATFVGNPPVIGDAPGSATITFTMGGGFTVNDPQLVATDRTVRLGLNRGYTNSSGNVSQRLSIIAVEG